MYRKRLLTAAVCMALAMASCTVGGTINKGGFTVRAEGVEASDLYADGSDTPAITAETTQSKEAPAEASTEAPPKTTEAPTEAPQPPTEAPQPPTETSAQTETTAPPETAAPQETSSEPATTAPTETIAPAQTETTATETTPNETQTESPSTEAQQATGNSTETGTESPSETPGETQTESETESESETDPEMESESESETSEYGSNEELIAHQQIIIPPDITLEFRFTQVQARIALVSRKDGTPVYEEKSDEAREVGKLEYYGSCYILEDNEDGWYYVESGNVRGFVKSDDMVSDGVAQRIANVKGMEELPAARLTVARTENAAFIYTHTTVKEVLAAKDYAIASSDLQIFEQRKESARVTGTLEKGGLCYVLADGDKDWIFVESGDVRGFVKSSSLLTGSVAADKVSDAGENNLTRAELEINPEDNKACYYTFTSVKEASQEAKTREAMVNFALQFIGNPYVWGGTSLTAGCDCSGFVQSIYASFGYSLPRVADAQSVYGMQIPVSSAEPGDLIFYAKNGYVYHVSMYIGNGQVVHAAGKNLGIITSGISGNAVWATRVIHA